MKQTIKKLFIFLVIFIISMVTLQNIALSEEKYEFERMWPELQQPWYFDGPHGIAIDSRGNVYVANYNNNNIQKFSSDGGFITNWGIQGNDNGEFEGPRGIAADKNGNIYVVDSGNNRVQKFTSDGEFIIKWGTSGSDNKEFNNPHGVATDEEGNVYIADSSNHRIQKFDLDGNFLMEWGTNGSGNGEFNNPIGIATDRNNNIYVVDKNNHRIQKFNNNGDFLIKWGSNGYGDDQFSKLTSIAVDKNGYVYVTEGFSVNDLLTIGNRSIKKFTSDGDFITKWGSFGPGEGEFIYLVGIATDDKNNLYVTDYEKNNIQKFNSDGTVISVWGAAGSGDGQFNVPNEIAEDKDGNIYVVDYGNHRIQKFNSDGNFIEKWGTEGSGDGEFYQPCGIAIDENSNVYVSECGNNRIQKFDSDGVFIRKWGSSGWLLDGEFNRPISITVGGDGNIYVADQNNKRIQKFSPEGEFIATWGSLFENRFNYPVGIAADDAENVYVVEYGSHRVQKLNTEGVVITTWGSQGNSQGQFNAPGGIAVDEEGDVYVADINNKRVQKFTSEGQFITKFGEYDSLFKLLAEPAYLCVSKSGKVYVSDDYSHSVQVFKKSDLPGPDDKVSKAIIVAGGPVDDPLWNVTQMCVNYAYRSLVYQGYDKKTIYYLSHRTDIDVDGNGEFDDVDNNSSNSNFEYAITEWAKDAEDLFIYITDHGGDKVFVMEPEKHLLASDLDSWLDTIQEIIPGKVVLVYDACHSGSFIPLLTPPQGKSRIVLTSTKPDQEAVFAAQGKVSFSFIFWASIFNGDSFYYSFIDAEKSMGLSYNQNYQLDANGNGIPNEEDDRITTRENVKIGNEILSAGDRPFIGSFGMSPENLNSETSAVIYAENVIDANGIGRVWAVIKPPNYTTGSPDNPATDLPVIDLKPKGDNRYEGVYDHFDDIGTYNITIYATDKKDVIVNLPKQITVTQTQGTQPDIVAVPTFSPEPGNYNASQTVIISCVTEGVIIRYTTDGSEPTIYSPGYTNPVSISETTTIKAKAYKTDGESGKTATGIYTIIIKGDINGDGTADMEDAMIALKVSAGLDISGMIRPDYSESLVDVNGDNNIGLEEVVYILSELVGLRK